VAAGLARPRQFSGRPLFGPIARWLEHFESLPDHAALNRLAHAAGLVSGGGMPIRFVPHSEAGLMYEQQIFERGEIPTRAGNAHDFFNALCWLTFPRAKAAMNARHRAHLTPGTRGAVRDAATQLDECGVVVLTANRKLAEQLIGHEWHAAFWRVRDALQSQMRFLVFGHALYERLHAPYRGLCGKSVFLEVDQALIDAPIESQCAWADARLAECLAQSDFCASPRMLHPLPLMGIPGVTPDNECEAYYLDTSQFRPRRPNHGADGRTPWFG